MYLPSSLDRQHAVNSCKVDTFCMILNTALNTRIRLISLLFTQGALYMIQMESNLANIYKFDPHACHIMICSTSAVGHTGRGIAKIITSTLHLFKTTRHNRLHFLCNPLLPFCKFKALKHTEMSGHFPSYGATLNG